MKENKIWKGIWSFPDKPKTFIHGSLEYSIHDGGTLEISEFVEDLNELFSMKHKFNIIWGYDLSGKKLTLYNCYLSTRKSGFSRISISTFLIGIIFEGIHFEDINELYFNRMKFEISNLWEFTQLSGFTKTMTLDHNKKPEKFNLEYSPLKPIEIKLSESEDLSIHFSTSIPFNYSNMFEFNEKTYVQINTIKSLGYDDFLRKGFIINNFISLGLSVPTYFDRIIAYSDQHITQLPDGNSY